MKIKSYSIRNITEALDKIRGESTHKGNIDAFAFLDALKATTPGETENVTIQTVEPE